jgi:uncharacterized protein (TIGR04141 family)
MEEEPQSNRLSIYLIKSEFNEHKDILKNFSKLKSMKIQELGEFYYEDSVARKPAWVTKFFLDSLNEVKKDLTSASAKGILLANILVSKKTHTFAIPFGYGHTLLNPGIYEERFGLKLALNSMDADGLHRIDTKNLASAPKDTIEQLSKAGDASEFEFDFEQDLVHSITGYTRKENSAFGKRMTGKDSVSLSPKVDISNIKDFLVNCYKQFNSQSYKKYFAWIDHISEIGDPILKNNLDKQLLENITSGDEKTWMAIPEIIEWSTVAGFSYSPTSSSDSFNDILLEEFLGSLPDHQRQKMSINYLKNKAVYCIDSTNDQVKYSWSVYNCLYCEIEDTKESIVYLLTNGKWYKIDKGFVNVINKEFDAISKTPPLIKLPDFKTSIHDTEASYNSWVAKNDNNFLCLDANNIFYGGGQSKIEFCDLLHSGRNFVHVKKYGGSSVFSHLFNQGIVSGELFAGDPDFRELVLEKIPTSMSKLRAIIPIEERPDTAKYNIIFAVISSKALSLPFFSKITLKNAKKHLEGYGYKVYLKKINETK